MKKLIVLAAALCLVATSAYAADWNFYGSSRVQTTYVKAETHGSTLDTTNLYEWLQSNARIGANVKASDSLSGRFEYGTGSGATTGFANVRLLYGVWNFGGGTLLVGQDYTPLFSIISNSIGNVTYTTLDEIDMLVFGNTYGGRKAQLKLAVGGFQVALMAPSVSHRTTAAGVIGAGAGAFTTEDMIPAIEASYRLAQDNWWAKAAAGYQTYDVLPGGIGTADTSINSYVVTGSAGVTFGPASFSGSVFFGQNAGNLVVVYPNNLATFGTGGLASYAAATGVTDNDCFGYNLVASYTANDMFKFEVGYGHVDTQYDVSGATKDDARTYYLQSVITLAKGVTVTPEIGVIDYQEDAQAKNTYFGAKWQLDF